MVTHEFRNQTNVPAKNHNCNARACPSNRCSNPSEFDLSLDYEQALSPLEYRSDAASAAECAGLRAQGPRLAVYRWAGAGEPGSQGDHGQLCEWAGPAAVRSADDGFAFAAWLCKRAVFVAAHCSSLLRAERFRDDCRARSAGLPQRLPRLQQVRRPSGSSGLPPAAVPPRCGSNCGMGRQMAPPFDWRSGVRHKRRKRRNPQRRTTSVAYVAGVYRFGAGNRPGRNTRCAPDGLHVVCLRRNERFWE